MSHLVTELEHLTSMQAPPSWDSYFMGMGVLTASRSKDPNTQVGCVLVGKDHRILATGYNGSPNSLDDSDIPWEIRYHEDPLNTKYPWVIHAEANAVFNAARQGISVLGSTAYVTLFPCGECAKTLVQSGVLKVVFLHTPEGFDPSSDLGYQLLTQCGVLLQQFVTD